MQDQNAYKEKLKNLKEADFADYFYGRKATLLSNVSRLTKAACPAKEAEILS